MLPFAAWELRPSLATSPGRVRPQLAMLPVEPRPRCRSARCPGRSPGPCRRPRRRHVSTHGLGPRPHRSVHGRPPSGSAGRASSTSSRAASRVRRCAGRSTRRRVASGPAASTGSTCSCSCCSWSARPRSAASVPTSRTTCTSTRSTTPGPRPSSSSTGGTASPTRSTSTRTRTSRSTRWRPASRCSAATGSAASETSARPVVDAAIEPRWAPPSSAGDRNGDRLYVATGTELRVHRPRHARPRSARWRCPPSRSRSTRARHRLFIAEDGRRDPHDRHDRARPPRSIGSMPRARAARAVQRRRRDAQSSAWSSPTAPSSRSAPMAGSMRTTSRPASCSASRRGRRRCDLVEIPWTDRVVVDRACHRGRRRAWPTGWPGSLARTSADARVAAASGTGARSWSPRYLDESARTEVASAIEEGTLDGRQARGGADGRGRRARAA